MRLLRAGAALEEIRPAGNPDFILPEGARRLDAARFSPTVETPEIVLLELG